MPYDVNNPPEKVRGLSENKQRQWVEVFNSCFEKHGDEELCSKEAWGVTGGWKDKENKEFTSEEIEVAEAFITKEVGLKIEIKMLEQEAEAELSREGTEELDELELSNWLAIEK